MGSFKSANFDLMRALGVTCAIAFGMWGVITGGNMETDRDSPEARGFEDGTSTDLSLLGSSLDATMDVEGVLLDIGRNACVTDLGGDDEDGFVRV